MIEIINQRLYSLREDIKLLEKGAPKELEKYVIQNRTNLEIRINELEYILTLIQG